LKLPINKENDETITNTIPIEYLGIGPKNIKYEILIKIKLNKTNFKKGSLSEFFVKTKNLNSPKIDKDIKKLNKTFLFISYDKND
tara:strand:+ start:98 stop:352 length:255 start_codon:yes stop_codon:yes gene_type:complete